MRPGPLPGSWEEKKEVVLALGYSERFWLKYR